MLISVVICVYNGELTIAKCIDSVLAQTYTDWQLVVIDDGSTDNTANIVRQYAEQDYRIQLYSQANQGLSSARKSGIRCVTGEYLLFIDADDYVGELYIEHFLEVLHSYPEAECIQGGYLWNEDGKAKATSAPEQTQYPPLEAITLPFHYYALWNRLWKTDFLKNHLNIIAEHQNHSEDAITICALYPHIKCFCFSPYVDYYYFIHNNNMHRQQLGFDDCIRILKDFMKYSNCDYWSKSLCVFKMQYVYIYGILTSIPYIERSVSRLVFDLKQLPSPLLSTSFIPTSGFTTYFYTWFLKHKLYRLFIYIAKFRFKRKAL